MYVATIPNRSSPPAVLLRESWREGGKVKKRTLANLSDWPADKVERLRRVLKGDVLISPEEALEITRSLPHGHVAAVLATMRRLGMERLLSTRAHPKRTLALAMIAARILEPGSKLATARGLDRETATTSLGPVLGLEEATADDLYDALDWLGRGHARIEDKLARRHLAEGTLLLYDVTSTYFEGRTCPLAALGHSRDGKKGKLQIVFGLLTTREGCPVAVEVFPGNTGDPTTLASVVEKITGRFGLRRVVLVGDRGMLTQARIREELRPAEGLEWISALRGPAIAKLTESGTLQLSLFDEQDLAEISSPDFPGERLIACRNPLLAEERARKREALLAATERELEKIALAVRRKKKPLRGQDRIALRVGKGLGRYKVGKHFRLEITRDSFTYARDREKIAAEAKLDGLDVIRTSVGEAELAAEEAVRAYKDLSAVEAAFRSTKTVDLEVRPIHHRRADRVRAHVFLCMLAYYGVWHMKRAWAPLLFRDHDKAAAAAARTSVVAPARRSAAAQRKAAGKRTEDGLPDHSFQTLLADLATLTSNRMRIASAAFWQTARPTPLQQRALDLLEGIAPGSLYPVACTRAR